MPWFASILWYPNLKNRYWSRTEIGSNIWFRPALDYLQLRILYPQTQGTDVALSISCFHGPLMPLSAQTGHYSVILVEALTIVFYNSYKGLRYVEHPPRIGSIAGTGFVGLRASNLRSSKLQSFATPKKWRGNTFRISIIPFRGWHLSSWGS